MIKICKLSLLLGLFFSVVSIANADTPEIIWTPTFYAVQPRTDVKNSVSNNFCLTHTDRKSVV